MNGSLHLVSAHKVIGFFIVVLIVGCFLGCSPSKDELLISQIKGSILTRYGNKTIDKAVNSFWGKPKWSVQRDTNGIEYVTVTGSIGLMDKNVTAALQFQTDKENSNFEVHALEFNGVPQTEDMLDALLQKMYATNTDSE